jgi:hypothetical protein
MMMHGTVDVKIFIQVLFWAIFFLSVYWMVVCSRVLRTRGDCLRVCVWGQRNRRLAAVFRGMLCCLQIFMCPFYTKNAAFSPAGVKLSTPWVILRQQQIISELSRVLLDVLCGCVDVWRCVGIVRAAWEGACTPCDSGVADPAIGSWYWNMAPCSLVAWCQGFEEFNASIFTDKKALVICLVMVLRGFVVWYQHFGEPYCLPTSGVLVNVVVLSSRRAPTFRGGGGKIVRLSSRKKAIMRCNSGNVFRPSVRPSVRRDLSVLKLYTGFERNVGRTVYWFCIDRVHVALPT